jgi:ABC-type sugar transport system ATPase subunit
MPEIALSIKDVTKSFGGVKVLKGISLEVYKGEIHAIVGENGAGKSVLMKTLMGVYQPEGGEFVVEGRQVRFSNPHEAQQQRVSMVYQEFGLVQSLTVAENIFMGRWPAQRGLVEWQKLYQESERLLETFGSKISTRAIVGDIKVADQQEVEVARALSFNPVVFIMDEPTAALSYEEMQHLFSLVRQLRQRGVAIIYISHKLDEVFNLADRITIIRDGAIVSTNKVNELGVDTLVERMTGKKISHEVQLRDHTERHKTLENILALRDFKAEGLFSDINLSIGKGEIVGVAGLKGAGKTELGKAVFGALPKNISASGTYIFDGREVEVKSLSPKKAKKMGIGYITEDRQAEGLIVDQSVSFNVTLPALHRVTRGLLIIGRIVSNLVVDIIKIVALRPAEPTRLVKFLSGGNQQKVVIGKWLASQTRLLILDEPTRGVDVRAREEIYEVMARQAKSGTSVLLLSSDLKEVIRICHRILIMRQGRITKEFLTHNTSEAELLKAVLGVENGAQLDHPDQDMGFTG